jgi:predicted GTPase
MSIAIPLLVVLAGVVLLAILLRKRSGPRDEGTVPAAGERVGGVQGHVLRDVAFIRQVLRDVSMAEDRRAGLEAQLQRLEARSRRRVLYLAVIGEFNSGKSTFINALLRRRLLKSANIATTAMATEIRHGSRVSLRVRLTDGTTLSGAEGDCAALAKRFEQFLEPGNAPVALQQVIELVTAHPEASRLVDTIGIEAPAEWLDRGICILDTPGAGAGPDYAAHHQAVTERVLAEQADVAVVLIPADSGISRTLLDFLDAVVRPFLNRCIFVITKLDGVEEQERPAILSHVNTTLAQFLGAAPVVLEAGALAVLLPAAPDSEKEAVRAYWRTEFGKLESFLLETMSRQGPAIVAETLIRLLHQAIRDLNDEIARRGEQVQQEQRTLEANSVMKIEQVLGRLRHQCLEAMNRTLVRVVDEMRGAAESFETRAKRQVGELIDDAAWGNLKQTITGRIPATIGEEERSFNQRLVTSFALLDRQCAESHLVFSAEFENCYRNLKSLGIPQLHRSVAAIPRTRAPIADFMHGTPFGNGPRWRDFIGIAVNKEKKREQLRAMLFPAIAAHVQGAASHWQARLNTAVAAISAELDRAVRTHLSQYAETVNAMIREHERRRAALQRVQSGMQAHAAELRRRAEQLDELKRKLSAGELPPSL